MAWLAAQALPFPKGAATPEAKAAAQDFYNKAVAAGAKGPGAPTGTNLVDQIANAGAMLLQGATPATQDQPGGQQLSIASGVGSGRLVLMLAVVAVLLWVGVKAFGRR